jgi:hypothetical protein
MTTPAHHPGSPQAPIPQPMAPKVAP